MGLPVLGAVAYEDRDIDPQTDALLQRTYAAGVMAEGLAETAAEMLMVAFPERVVPFTSSQIPVLSGTYRVRPENIDVPVQLALVLAFQPDREGILVGLRHHLFALFARRSFERYGEVSEQYGGADIQLIRASLLLGDDLLQVEFEPTWGEIVVNRDGQLVLTGRYLTYPEPPAA